MLDLGWQEFVMVGIVLVLVVGPKDMPRVLRAVAKYVGKARGVARDFQTSMMDVANQDEFRDVKNALQDVKTGKIDALADFADVKETAQGAAENMMADGDLKESVNTIKQAADDFKGAKPESAQSKAAQTATKKSAKKSAQKSLGKSAPKKATAKKTTKKKATS